MTLKGSIISILTDIILSDDSIWRIRSAPCYCNIKHTITDIRLCMIQVLRSSRHYSNIHTIDTKCSSEIICLPPSKVVLSIAVDRSPITSSLLNVVTAAT